MSDKEEQELRIFQLCKELAKRLGDEEAIADLKALRNLHPEMFKDMQEVANLIQEVVTESKIIIVKNPRPMSEKDYIAGLYNSIEEGMMNWPYVEAYYLNCDFLSVITGRISII